MLITQVLRQCEALLAAGDPAVVFFPRAERRWQGRGRVARVLPQIIAVPHARGAGWSLAARVIPADRWPTKAAR